MPHTHNEYEEKTCFFLTWCLCWYWSWIAIMFIFRINVCLFVTFAIYGRQVGHRKDSSIEREWEKKTTFNHMTISLSAVLVANVTFFLMLLWLWFWHGAQTVFHSRRLPCVFRFRLQFSFIQNSKVENFWRFSSGTLYTVIFLSFVTRENAPMEIYGSNGMFQTVKPATISIHKYNLWDLPAFRPAQRVYGTKNVYHRKHRIYSLRLNK